MQLGQGRRDGMRAHHLGVHPDDIFRDPGVPMRSPLSGGSAASKGAVHATGSAADQGHAAATVHETVLHGVNGCRKWLLTVVFEPTHHVAVLIQRSYYVNVARIYVKTVVPLLTIEFLMILMLTFIADDERRT